MNNTVALVVGRLPSRVILTCVLLGLPATAQDNLQSVDSGDVESLNAASIEEVTVVAGAPVGETDVESERILSDVQADYIDSEFISSVGDSDAATLLRRVPGVTLAQGKFVYVRGLGERYSSAQLNGSVVPSPDITRNVLPLDIFPSDIIDSIEVQKGYSPEQSAAFGGGNVDIRTKKIPSSHLFHFDVKTGTNSMSGDSLSHPGGGSDRFGYDDGTRALSATISNAINIYQGSLSPVHILRSQIPEVPVSTISEAKSINRQLATFLNRDINLEMGATPIDAEIEMLAGFRQDLTSYLDVGVQALGSYSNDVRNRQHTVRRLTNPTTDFAETLRSTHEVNLTGSLGLGVGLTNDHEFGSLHLFLRNTEDDSSSARTCNQGQFNDCFDSTSPNQGRRYGLRYEQRQLEMHQFYGKHVIGDDTLDRLPSVLDSLIDTQVTWYYTLATAETSIPNEVSISGQESLDSPNGTATSYSVRTSATSAEFRFSNLVDEVESYGVDVMLPVMRDGLSIELSGGFDYSFKDRSYRQTSLGIGSSIPGFNAINSNTPSEVFSDANLLNPNNGIELQVGIGEFGSESYLAAQQVIAGYGKVDFLVNETWRIAGGARSETFEQEVLPVDYLSYDMSRYDLANRSRFKTDDVYPSVAVTYINPGFFADEFQLRGGVSQTTTRPDIRETSASTYIDPLTEARVRGNPDLEVSDLTNLDLRAEWFWYNNDMLSVSLFHKDITKPIETVEGGATEDNIRLNFVNADSATVYGTEIEWKKSLHFLADSFGAWAETLYFAGNSTLSDSEIYLPVGDRVGNLTNDRRPMSQQSPWVLNLQLSYDSQDIRHSSSIIYNVFGERVFFAGTGGQPDAYEQPFHSLDFVYRFYPTENLTFKLRLKNVLQSSVMVDQGEVNIIEQEVGSSFLFNAKWEM